jgi:hypothetical protein
MSVSTNTCFVIIHAKKKSQVNNSTTDFFLGDFSCILFDGSELVRTVRGDLPAFRAGAFFISFEHLDWTAAAL